MRMKKEPIQQPHHELEAELQRLPQSLLGSERHVQLLLELAWELALIDSPRSVQLTAEARTLAENQGNEQGMAYALRNEGYHLGISSRLQEALPILNDALQRFELLDDKNGIATTLDTLAFAHWRLGDYEKAHNLSSESLVLNREIGNKRGEAWALHNIAGINNDNGEVKKAIGFYKQALKIFDGIGYGTGSSRVLNCLGDSYYAVGNLQQALACNMESLQTYRDTNLLLGTAGTMVAIARILADLNDHDGAEDYFQQALQALESTGNIEAKANARLYYGAFRLQTDEREAGMQLLQEALDLIEKTAARPTALKIHQLLYQEFESTGQLREALLHYKRYHELKEQLYSEKSREKLQNLQILRDLEKAEQEAEIHRLKYTELAEMQAQLVQSERLALLGNLVAGIAHEVNTPVSVISSNADVSRRALAKISEQLNRQLKGDSNGTLPAIDKTLELLTKNNDATVAAGQKISALIQRLKNFASLDEAEEQVIDIRKGLEDTLVLLRAKLPEGTKIVQVLNDIPPIYCFPQALNQVFMTLVSNAIDAIDDIGTVFVNTRAHDKWIIVEISDTGRGIPAEQLEKIFDVGFSRKNQTVQMSVGLANAYNIIQKHNGQITATSKVGHGSQFTIRLPMTRRTEN